jgi:hypothetical protein
MLMVWYVPLPGGHTQHEPVSMQEMDHTHLHMDAPVPAKAAPSPLEDAFNTHVLGMWLGFC